MLKGLVPPALLAGIVSLVVVACGGDAEPTPTSQRDSPPPPPPVPRTVVVETPTPISPCRPEPQTGGESVTVINRDLAGSGEYGFDPAELTFNVGDTVNITLIAETELHSFTVNELGIDVDIDGAETPGKTETLACTFDEPGTFQLVCIYHEGNGMVGTITVVETPGRTPAPTPTAIEPQEGGITVNVINRDLGGSGEYAFDPAEFSFNVGDTVTFINTAETELHSFTVDELGIDVDIDGATTPGITESITFTFDKPGTFPLVCIYHEGNGMMGTITVE